jgi:hypothetical protein
VFARSGNALWATAESTAKTNTPTSLGHGSHLYITLRRAVSIAAPGNPTTVSSNVSLACVTRNLADAVAALAGTFDDTTAPIGGYAYSNALYPLAATLQMAPLNICGFYHQLTLRASDDFQV